MQTLYNNDGEQITIDFKTPFNHNTTAEAARVALDCKDPSKTQQHGRDEADINTIVNRFLKTGLLPQVPMPPSYQDFEDVFDMQTALNTIAAGKASFMQMPAEIRDAFRNDPARFVDQVTSMASEQDPAKRAENLKILRAMNLAVPEGPIADRTTLGDVLKAIKEQGTPKEPSAPKNP